MFIEEFEVKTAHERKSKLGKIHFYYRYKTYAKFRCDSCDKDFIRERGKMNPKRLNNNYFHVCKQCDPKKFAQKRGVERRKIWNLSASSDLPISKL